MRRRVRFASSRGARTLPFIALTGWGQERDKEQALEAGCDGHLLKPVKLNDLEKLLNEVAKK